MRSALLAALSTLSLLGVGAASAPAANYYYVAPPPAGSNTTGQGTEMSPWATINYAESHSAQGDLILVKPGSYPEDVTITHPTAISSEYFSFGNVTVRSFNVAASKTILANMTVSGAVGACVTVQPNLTKVWLYDDTIRKCGGEGVEQLPPASEVSRIGDTTVSETGLAGSQWKPPKTLTWYWQLQGALVSMTSGAPGAATAWDVDGFETSKATVEALHAAAHKAVCYIDVGTWEEWRSDASSFPAAVKGKNNGWPGEKYLDIRALSTLEPIMTKRFEMCRSKGFDAVEPDNMDTFEASTGFPLTGTQQISYDTWVAGEVHSLGMAVLQKNDGEQTSSLKAHFDGALTEECNVYSECSNFAPYLAEGKPVLNAEYGSSTAFCAADNAAGIEGARFDLELDGKVFQPCW